MAALSSLRTSSRGGDWGLEVLVFITLEKAKKSRVVTVQAPIRASGRIVGVIRLVHGLVTQEAQPAGQGRKNSGQGGPEGPNSQLRERELITVHAE